MIQREVMTFDYKIIPVRTETIDSLHEINGFSERRKTVSRKFKRDRRKQDKDRRSSIRDGIIVSLSFKTNRRKGTDRRKSQISRFLKS
ncbi:MAG: hypothetical protein A2328_05735 [Bdellovibrionales bacterium RIFOXYB2_FULL_36_6]|nr:MAG: hypothetical protein A2328_05735 [Bdellovibrionales bacterium RIFOXYB2_FULL_36_6]